MKQRLLYYAVVLLTIICVALVCSSVVIYQEATNEYTAIEDLEGLVRIFGKKDGTIPADMPGGVNSHGWKVISLVLQNLVDHGHDECNGRIMEFHETQWLTNPRAGGSDYIAVELTNGDLIFFLRPIENQVNLQERLEKKASEMNKDVAMVRGNLDHITYAAIADNSMLYVELLRYYSTGGYSSEYRGEGAQEYTLDEIWAKYE